MSHIATSSIYDALETICTHRDVVPAYYVRSLRRWVVTGHAKTAGGAVVVNDLGEIEAVCASKRDALASLGSN